MSADAFGGDVQRLSALIGAKLANGSLPPYGGQRTYGGRGDDARCACCDQPIGSADIQYDVDAAGRTIAMHLACYRLWVELSGTPAAPPRP